MLFNSPLPVSHCAPDHPTSQAHVSGEEQVPPFRQGLLQVAVGGESTLAQTLQTRYHYKANSLMMSIDNTAIQLLYQLKIRSQQITCSITCGSCMYFFFLHV